MYFSNFFGAIRRTAFYINQLIIKHKIMHWPIWHGGCGVKDEKMQKR